MNRLLNRLFRISPLVLAGYWAALFIGTHYPRGVPMMPSMWPHFDKLVHFVAFFGLAFLAAAATNYKVSLTGWHYRRLVGWLLLYAAVDEALQLIPALNRNADVFDWIANSAGVTAGLIVYWRLAAYARYRLGLRLERQQLDADRLAAGKDGQ